jgi:hypothetical protein
LGVVVKEWADRRAKGLEEKEWLAGAMERGYGDPRGKKNEEVKAFGIEIGDRLLGFSRGERGETERVAPNWR